MEHGRSGDSGEAYGASPGPTGMITPADMERAWCCSKRVLPQHTDHAGVLWHGAYVAWLEEARVEALDAPVTFRLHADGTGSGAGPSGTVHDRFRAWKEDLRDHPDG